VGGQTLCAGGDESAGLRDVPVAPMARQIRVRAAGRPIRMRTTPRSA